MILYWFVLSIPLICSLIKLEKFKNINSFFWILFSFILIIFLGFRFEVGGDWQIYTFNFHITGESFKINTFNLKSDYLFELLSWIIYKLGFNLILLNLICSIIFVYAIISFCKVQKQPWLAIFISLTYLGFIVSTGYVRQATAIAFLIIAYLNLIKDRNFNFILLVIIASFFHKSAVIGFVPAFYVVYKNNYIVQLIMIIVCIAIIYYFLSNFQFLLNMYMGTGRVSINYDSSSGAFIRASMNLIPAFLCIIYGNQLSANNKERRLFFIISVICLLSIFLVYNYPTLIDRLLLYFIILQVYVFSRFPLVLKINFNVYSANIIIMIFYIVTFFVWLNYSVHSFAWIPYKYKFDLLLS